MSDESTTVLQDLIGTALRDLEDALVGREIRIVRQIDPTTPALEIAPDLVRPVVETLLAEAAAGTVRGGRIRVCLKHSHGSLMISVKDQGAGLKPGEFDERVSDDARPASPGAPLTLARCRASVAAIGGNLFANSAEDRGSTYYVILPLPAA